MDSDKLTSKRTLRGCNGLKSVVSMEAAGNEAKIGKDYTKEMARVASVSPWEPEVRPSFCLTDRHCQQVEMSGKSLHKIKIVIMGSGGVGKSALTVQYTSGTFLKRYDPTIEETYTKPIDVDERSFMLEILDTAGTEQFTEMRDIYIKEGDGIMLVFSLVSDSTFHGINKIHEQISKVKGDDVPLLLVGNKSDLEPRMVKREDAIALANQITKGAYMEASAKINFNVTEIFVELVRRIVAKMPKPVVKPARRGCTIL